MGQAFTLDGVDDFVLVLDSDNLNITGDVTVDLWAKRTVFGGGFPTMVEKGAGQIGAADAPAAYLLYFDSTDLLFAGFERADGSNVFLAGPAVADANFHHYAYVRRGNAHEVFMDGDMVAGDSFTGSPGDTSGIELVLGATRHDPNPSGFINHFGGIIDEVEIFNRALSIAEIRAIYDAGSLGKVKPPLPSQSTFDNDDEGWEVVGDAQGASATPTYVAGGGNPGGYVEAKDDVSGGPWYWQAPAKFLGNNSTKKTLSDDLKQSATDSPFDAEDVILMGGGITLDFDTTNNPGSDWTHYDVPLDTTLGG